MDRELVKTLDYILNRCDEGAIDAVAEAVVRRRRQLALFGASLAVPDPKRMAREISGQINIGASIEGLRETVRSMAVRILRQEAPELADEQIDELVAGWIPGVRAGDGVTTDTGLSLPPAALSSMIDQFVSFSRGTMNKTEEKELRGELGAWPKRYWESFPPVVRLLITDYIRNEINEKEFRSKIDAAIAMEN
ncbi:MAG: hypothetical protein LBI86_00405 [Treponema sp.]|nr:hypothetical protein [Treponema sp.]